MTGLPDGDSIGDFGELGWRDGVRAPGRRRVRHDQPRGRASSIWIGLPQTPDAGQTQRFDVVNAVVAAARRASAPARAAYVDTYTTVRRRRRRLRRVPARRARRQLVKVRADDGVHFEPAGGDMIAREVLKTLNKHVRPHELAQEAEGLTSHLVHSRVPAAPVGPSRRRRVPGWTSA